MRNILCCGIIFTTAIVLIVNCEYEIEFKGFKVLPGLCNESYINPGTLSMRQDRRNQYILTGTIEAVIVLHVDTYIKIEYFHKIYTENLVLMFISVVGVCDCMKKDFYKKVKAVSNVPSKCPIQNGTYTINDLVIDQSFFPTSLPLGDGLVILTIYIQNIPIYGCQMASHIEEY